MESSIAVFGSLAPKTYALTEIIKQTYHQACVLKYALNFNLPDMSPTDFGWLFEETSWSLSPVTVPLGIAHVP